MTDTRRTSSIASPKRIAKALNRLMGFLNGIVADGRVGATETRHFASWRDEYRDLRTRAPFDEIYGMLEAALRIGTIERDEILKLVWTCDRFSHLAKHDDAVTTDLQYLHGLLEGVTADGDLGPAELEEVGRWLEDHTHLEGLWPYDEILALVVHSHHRSPLAESDTRVLLHFLTECADDDTSSPFTFPLNERNEPITGVCAFAPKIDLRGKTACIADDLPETSRIEIEHTIRSMGGHVSESVTHEVDYLLIADSRSATWSFDAYGRKAEEALKLRRSGLKLVLVHESTFWDCIRISATG